MANDNLLAGLAGAAEGVKGVLVPWLEANHQAQLQDQLMKSRGQQDLNTFSTKLPWEEASKQRLSQVNIPSDIGADFGIPPGNIDREILPLYMQRMKNKEMGLEKGAASSEKDQKQQDALEKQYRDMFEKGLSNRSGGLGMQDQKVNQALHLRSMLDQYYDPKTKQYSVPKSQYEELAIGLANLMSGGGQATESMRNGIVQRTAKGDINGAVSYILGTTPSASSDAVFKNLSDSVDRQGLVSEKLRDQYYGQMRSKAPTSLARERRAQIERENFGSSYANALKNSPAGSGAANSPKPNGVLHQDAQGNKAWVYPDGTFDEVK